MQEIRNRFLRLTGINWRYQGRREYQFHRTTKVFESFKGGEGLEFFNRNLEIYRQLAFVDDSDRSLSTRIRNFLGLRIQDPSPSLNLHSFVDDGKFIQEKNDPKQRIFGGLKDFFEKGTHLVDIGGGGGMAAAEISLKYPHLKVVCIDLRFGIQLPPGRLLPGQRASYVAAAWASIPFADNSFDRILTVESFLAFPFSLAKSKENVLQAVREITRVATDRAIWRGSYGEQGFLPKMLAHEGWDVYLVPPYSLVARLSK